MSSSLFLPTYFFMNNLPSAEFIKRKIDQYFLLYDTLGAHNIESVKASQFNFYETSV
jgi:hypothetical protein